MPVTGTGARFPALARRQETTVGGPGLGCPAHYVTQKSQALFLVLTGAAITTENLIAQSPSCVHLGYTGSGEWLGARARG